MTKQWWAAAFHLSRLTWSSRTPAFWPHSGFCLLASSLFSCYLSHPPFLFSRSRINRRELLMSSTYNLPCLLTLKVLRLQPNHAYFYVTSVAFCHIFMVATAWTSGLSGHLCKSLRTKILLPAQGLHSRRKIMSTKIIKQYIVCY